MYFFEFPFSRDDIVTNALVVFSGQLEGGATDYSLEIESNFEKFNERPEEVFLVVPGYIENAVRPLFVPEAECYDNITRFGSEIPVTLLSFDKFGCLTPIRIWGTSDICMDMAELREQLINSGLLNLARIRREQIILKSPSGTVFIKPSKQEYDEFIKASELAVGSSETQFVAFSLLSKAPQDREVKKIYIDTNSISSFIESLLYYWVKFDEGHCKSAIYDSYSSYDGKDEARPDIATDVWLVISASTTNYMGIKMAEEWGLENDQVITLLSYTEPKKDNVGDKILLNISALSESRLRESGNNALLKVKLLGENFTAEVKEPHPVVIRKKHSAQAIGDWIEPNSDTNLIRCNRKAVSEREVSAVHIDCEKYFSTNSEFESWLDSIVDWYVPASAKWLVCEYADSASMTLVEKIETKCYEIGVSKLTKVDFEEAHDRISGDGAILIVTPVAFNGGELLRLNRNLRISGHNGNRIFISPFVISQSEERFNTFKKSLLFGPSFLKYQFFCLHKAFVGCSDKENSWFKELEVVESLDTQFWKARANRLRLQSDGLNGFLGTPSISEDEKLVFSQNFAFWRRDYDPHNVNHEAVFLTIASVLQQLREKSSLGDEDSLFAHTYQHAVISPENFSRFSDGLIQSCLWRAATSREIDYRSSTGLSSDMAEIVSRLVVENSKGIPNSAVDLLMGIVVGKIQIDRDILRKLLEEAIKNYKDINENALLLVEHMQRKFFESEYPAIDSLAI